MEDEKEIRSRKDLFHDEITIVPYESENQLPFIQDLVSQDLSEPYSIFTYRYFLNNWPRYSFLAMKGSECIGCVVCKMDYSKRDKLRGYIAMLAVRKDCRNRGLGTTLVKAAIQNMIEDNCDEVVLEAEYCNEGALTLYENLGFLRDKLLEKYYLNGSDAYRLKLEL